MSKTLHSVLKQTHNDFEIIIINDGSTDETGDLLDVFKDERIRLYNLKKQNNLAKLRNYGVQMSKGEFISFCDDDDLWETDKLEIQMTYLQNHDFICTNVKLIDINDIILDTHYIKFKNHLY
ncbi:MAG: glycosyltransferase family 2 protein [Ignavibacteria bacterium]|nr:glycosyltransferase family 2 protein [Ignavibacteria bacterium]